MNTTKKTSRSTKQIADNRGFQLFEAIGRFSVRFRWLIVLVWLVGVIGIVHSFPSLTSVTQSDNSAFLPNTSPTEKALNLVSVFGATSGTPVDVVVARTNAP